MTLDIDSGDNYVISNGDTEEHDTVKLDGQLTLNGTLRLVENPDSPQPVRDPQTEPLDFPMSITSLQDMNMGFSIFIIGFVGILLGAIAFLQNYAAGVVLGLSLTALLMSGVLGIGLELFYALLIATVLTIIAGFIARVV